MKTTHRRMIRGTSSSSSPSVSTKVTRAPAKKEQKYSVQEKSKKTKGQRVLICSPKSMLATTGVPGRVLGLRDFLEAGRPDEEPSVCPLFETLRGPRGTGRGTYSSYTSTTLEETPGNAVVIWNLLIIEAPARFSPVFTTAGRTSRGIGSTKLRPNSYKEE